jgi:hypothetical protein
VRVRVHLCERGFPEEPDRRASTGNASDVRTALDTGAALGGVTGIASRRMIVTCMWGVSDPRRAGRGAKKGTAKWGVAHAPLAALLGCDSGADSRPAAQSAAGCRREAADWQEDRASVIVQRALRRLVSANSPGVSRGTVLPSFGSPTVFPSEVSTQPATRVGETAR